MGSITDACIAAFQEQTGIKPASGEYGEALRALSVECYQMILLIESEASGLRDGDGAWHGSDVFGGGLDDLSDLIWTIRNNRIGDMENARYARELGPEYISERAAA